ncbi:MAG TPA: response regulator transcription factor [Chitinophagaceae bacterium]|nr:response regulator transcription factor [Chitinophagaceae bacterium]
MEQQINIVKIAMVDDHVLLRNALARLIAGFDNCRVVLEVANGRELINQLKKDDLPDVILLDLNMPGMDGFETAAWLHNNHPSVHILMLTMYDSDQALIRLLQFGVKGFLKKDIHPAELSFAIRSVVQSGFYYSQHVSGKMANLFRNKNGNVMALERAMLTAQEILFLKLASSDMTYKEIAMQMKLNPRAVDSLRDHLFEKLEIKSRVGLAMYAIRQGIVAL